MASRISSKFKKIIKKIYKISKPKYLVPKEGLSEENFGIIDRLNKTFPKEPQSNREKFITQLINVYGIQIEFPFNIKDEVKGIKTIKKGIKHLGILYDKSVFNSYDGLEIPIYVIYPSNFNSKNKHPTIILFSGHGSANQAAFEENSYQHGGGLVLAQHGFLVYVMENRGMGELSFLGNHLRIDAIAKIVGGTWYGEIITDALWLIENLQHEKIVDLSRIGCAGISTGGGLSMIVSALDDRITATYIQGYLGSFRKTFGTRANHCLCGHIPNILKICDMSDIASLIAPRSSLFVNGTADSFFYTDAKKEFNKIFEFYKKFDAKDKSKFLAPEGVGHEFSVKIAIEWFTKQLKHD